MAIIIVTDMMPMIIPNKVSALRRRCARSAATAVRAASASPLNAASQDDSVSLARGVEVPCSEIGAARSAHAVGDDRAVGKFDDASGVRRDLKIMRRNDDRMALTVQFLQKLDHLAAIGVVERAGWFVRQNDRPAVHQGAGDGDALLLSAR